MKSRDPHSVYGYDPETGLAREPVQLDPLPRPDTRQACLGCGARIDHGQVVMVTVQAGNHVITVPAHDGHRESARASALEDKSWQRSRSHYAG